MLLIVLYILGILVYLGLPLPAQITVLLLNTFIPDPLPFVDEIIMYGSTIKKCYKTINIISKVEGIILWVETHKIIMAILCVFVIVILIVMIF
jgi:hypothetical protein